MSETNKSSFEKEHGIATMPSRKRSYEDVALDPVRKDGLTLENAQDLESFKALYFKKEHGIATMLSRKRPYADVVLDSIRKDGLTPENVQDLEAFRAFAWTIAMRDPFDLTIASKARKGDKAFVLAAVTKDGRTLYYASEDLKGDKDVVLAAVRNDGQALQYASEDLNGDKDVVLAAVEENGYALQFLNKDMQCDRNIVLAAVTQKGYALRYANEDMKEDKGIVLAAVKQNGLALQFASDNLQADKEVVCAAAQNDPDALKFAKDGLYQDDESWIAAGLWNEKHSVASIDPSCTTKQPPILFVLSTRFSLHERSESPVTRFTKLLNDATLAQTGNFEIYSPNKFSKHSCDEKWTRMEWPCRGTDKSCTMTNEMIEGKPHDGCCWRFSFRWHLEKAKETNGVMIQVVDCIDKGCPSDNEHILGDGQKIENVMAKDIGTKIFRIYQPYGSSSSSGRGLGDFKPDHINTLLSKIQCWYDDGCKDMTDCEILSKKTKFRMREDSKRISTPWFVDLCDKMPGLNKVNGHAVQFARKDMKGDKERILAAVRKHGLALRYASEDLQADKEVVLAAVRHFGTALQYASKDMKEDKEVVLAAVKQNGLALQYASNNLQADKEVVCAAAQNDPDALKFAKDGLYQDDESWIAAGL